MYIYRDFFKHLIDVVLAFSALVVLSPVVIVVFICLAIVNKGKPFFFQDRPGKDAKIFRIVKFKTMTEQRDLNGELLPDYLRITAIGRFVRKTSLDEIPQLLNVLKGDMSLIGPRPLLVRYLVLYNDEQKRRHLVKPGITGWAQINGRNAISWRQKFELDVFYVDHLSLVLDLKIIYTTFVKVFKSEGVNSSENTTMEEFKGNN